MWSKNIHEEKKVRKRRLYALLTGVILILAVFSKVSLYSKDRTHMDSETVQQEAGGKIIRPGHQEYSEIRTLTLEENFPGDNWMMQIDFIENTVMYGRINFPELRTKEHFSDEEKKELIDLLEKYRFLEWVIVSDTYRTEDKYGIIDKYGIMGEDKEGIPKFPSDRDDNYEKRVDLLNINEEEDYIGMGENELWYRRQPYDMRLLYETHNSKDPVQILMNEIRWVPDGYGGLADELWDFALRHVVEPDWRSTINQRVNEELSNAFSCRINETVGIPDYNNIWYFSINEFFGGREHGPGAAFTYEQFNGMTTDYDEMLNQVTYNTWYDKGINVIDTSGNIQKYRLADEWFKNKWMETGNIMPMFYDNLKEEKTQELIGILEKYQVTSWREPEYYQNQQKPCHIREGEFFNLIPELHYDGLSEQELEIRSTFETFIYLYDKDGKRLRLHYDNTGLPENYNEFRKELWDFAMEYMAGHKEYLHIYDYYKEPDWRTLLDKWGRDHLEIMQEKSAEIIQEKSADVSEAE